MQHFPAMGESNNSYLPIQPGWLQGHFISIQQCGDMSCETSSPFRKRRTEPQAVVPGHCNHSFNLLKSESTLIQWTCSMCYSGPHWYIFECKYCRLKACRPCTNKSLEESS
ncbi:hypothetical protein BGZ60DRAFT_419039 [Tricladium varicosporioides]|nr:hypothetical protein BGZ60DRAFT_419039 [Hymenoscyphus varicosporioides]